MPTLPGNPQLVTPRGGGGIVRGISDPGAVAISNTGARLVGAANRLQHAFDEEQARVDRNIVEDSFNTLRQRQMELEVGEDGYSKIKSGDAVKTPLIKNYSKQLEDSYKDLTGKLTNDRQRQAFRQRYDVAKSQFQKGVLTHVTRENQTYRKQVMDTTVDTEKNFSALRWNLKGEIYASRERAKASVDEFAEVNGLDAKAKSVLYRDATTQIHQAVIERAINEGNSDYASKWLKDHRSEIDAGVATSLQATLKTAGDIEASQQAFDRIISGKPDYPTALAAARKTKSNIRDKVLSRVRSWDSDNQRLKARYEKENTDEAWRVAVATEDPWAINTTNWTELPGQTQREILQWTEAKKRADAQPPTVDDVSVVIGVQDMIEAGDITEPEQLIKYQPYMKPSTLNSLIGEIDKREDLNPKLIKDAFILATGKKVEEGNYEEWRNFQDYITENVKRPEDLNSYVDEWRMKGESVTTKFFSNDPGTVGEAVELGREDFLIDVPEDSADNVSASVSLLGQQTGETAQKEFYTKYYRDAQRWLKAHKSAVSPALVSGYAYCKAKGLPLTAKNINWAAQELSK